MSLSLAHLHIQLGGGLAVARFHSGLFLGLLEERILVTVLKLGGKLVEELQGALQPDVHATFLLKESHEIFLSHATVILHRLLSFALLELCEP